MTWTPSRNRAIPRGVLQSDRDDEFNAFGKPVPSSRKANAEKHFLDMGGDIYSTEQRMHCIGRMTKCVEHNRPYDAILVASEYFDVTGCCRLLSAICTDGDEHNMESQERTAMRFKVRGEETEPVVEFWLEPSKDGDRVMLYAKGDVVDWIVASFGDASMILNSGLPRDLGIPLDHCNRIQVAGQSVKERHAGEMYEALNRAEPYLDGMCGVAALLAKIEAEENGDG